MPQLTETLGSWAEFAMVDAMVIAMLIGVCATQATSSLPSIDSLWNYADPAGTREKFLGLLSQPEPMPHDYRIELLTQVARCEGLEGDFDAAHRTLDRVEADLDGSSETCRVRYWLERGRAFNSSGLPQQAKPLFEQAAGVEPVGASKPLVIDAMHMLAIVCIDPAEQIAWAQRGIRLAQAEPPVLRWLIPLLNNLGETYRSQGDYAEALRCFQQLIETYPKLGRPVDRYARVDEAKMLRLVGRGDEAFERISVLRDELARAGETDGFVEEELAEGLLARGDGRAGETFGRAWALLKQETWIEQHEPDRWARLRQLAGDTSAE